MRTYARRMSGAFALASVLSIAAITGAFTASPAIAACMAGDRVDGTTANDALRRFASAGFPSVSDLRKGCDNYWHGIANRDGEQIRVVLSPAGQVMKEGD